MAVRVENSPAKAGDVRDMGLIPGLGGSSGGGQSTPVFLSGESHGQRSLANKACCLMSVQNKMK